MRSETPFISALMSDASSFALPRRGDLLAGDALAVAERLHLPDEGAALRVERPGIDPGEAGKGLHVFQGLAAARQHGEDGLPVLHHELQIQHDRAQDSMATLGPRGTRGSISPR
jgi:hypothetical protein